MKKTGRTQNGKKSAFDTIITTRFGTYKEEIRRVYHYDRHMAELTETRNKLIEQIKVKFGKSDENIEFELRKLRKD